MTARKPPADSAEEAAAHEEKSAAVAAAIAAGVPSYEAWEMSDKDLAKYAPEQPAEES